MDEDVPQITILLVAGLITLRFVYLLFPGRVNSAVAPVVASLAHPRTRPVRSRLWARLTGRRLHECNIC